MMLPMSRWHPDETLTMEDTTQPEANLPVSPTDTKSYVPTAVSAIARTREEIAQDVFDRIADGESLTAVCNDPGLPTRRTLTRWCGEDSLIMGMYRAAIQMRAVGMQEQLIELSAQLDDPEITSERVQAIKVKINTLQWTMSRLLRAQYGDHQTVEHTGEVKMDSAQLDVRLKQLISQVKKLR